MACILQLKCNFLHGIFRCHLPVGMVDAEVRITSMQGTHTFRNDRTSQLIKCSPWSTRLHPQPTTIKKMKTYHELEGKFGPKPKPSPISLDPSTQHLSPCKERIQSNRKKKSLLPTKKYKVKVDPINMTM